MELEDIVYELACLHESMLFCCEDRVRQGGPGLRALLHGAGEDCRGPRRGRAAHPDRNGQRRIPSIEKHPGKRASLLEKTDGNAAVS